MSRLVVVLLVNVDYQGVFYGAMAAIYVRLMA